MSVENTTPGQSQGRGGEPTGDGSANGEPEVITKATYDLIEALCEAGVELSEKGGQLAFKAPPGKLTSALKKRMREQKPALLALLGPDKSARANLRILPLSELQQSYWLGEASVRGIAGAGYWYNRFSLPELDLERLQQALDAVIARHDALRAIVGADGRMRILDRVGPFPLEYRDLRAMEAGEAAREVEAVGKMMSRPFTAADEWPLYRMCAQQAKDRFTVHVAGRLLVADAGSWQLYVKELGALLEDPYRSDLPDPGRLAIEVLGRFRRLVSKRYQRDRKYWTSRSLPPSPLLPVRGLAEGGSGLTRLIAHLPEPEADRLTARSKELGLTTDNVLLAASALVMAYWSQRPEFCINVLASSRYSPGLPLGQFGGLLRLEVAVQRESSFADLARALRDQLARDMSHVWVDGVTVQQLTARQTGVPARGGVVVYSSGLSFGKLDSELGLAQLGWTPEESCLQSPGVLLDQQVFQTRDALQFQWDVDMDAFCPGVAEAMFETYMALLRRLAGTHDWSTPLRVVLPQDQQEVRIKANDTSRERSVRHLHTLLEQQIRSRSTPAVVTPEGTLSYAELGSHASSVASTLRRLDALRDVPIAICASKGWRQVAAALGILRTGAAYVPIDPAWPRARAERVLSAAGCRIALCDSAGADTLASEAENGKVTIVQLDETSPASGDAEDPGWDGSRLAYIIFTSGSTGEPKGVAISHDAVANTIEDMLERFTLGPDDCVLGVSKLHFDLSVFDIFGVLGAGGRLVLPPAKAYPDPADLVPLIQEHCVTIWNTVPAIMEMVVEYAEAKEIQLPTIRLVLLSGDWIPVGLPDRIRAVCANARVVSLGGATEASIWSVAFDINDVPGSWSSIPYGFPLANQQLLILNEHGEPRPDWVDGDLAIAGDGLADGYWQSPDKTASAFVHNPTTEQRIYHTGDRARRWPDGNIEFLGRLDGQVKINGYRVEIGDVTAALNKCTGVDRAAVVAVGPREHRWLAAFVTPASLHTGEIQDQLQSILPSYMVPRRIEGLAELPLTGNGKVNQASLAELALRGQPISHPPRTPNERVMAELWSEILSRPINDARASFFEVGGESVLAVRLVNAIEQRCGIRTHLADILRAPTIEGMANVLEGGKSNGYGAIVRMQRGASAVPSVVCIHPVGGTVYCYRSLVAQLGKDVNLVGLQSLGIKRGDWSLRSLAEYYAEQLQSKSIQPAVLFGWSMGGALALEVQRCLEGIGGRRISTVMIDPWVRRKGAPAPDIRALQIAFIGDVLRGTGTVSREELAERLETRSLLEVVHSIDSETLGRRMHASEITALFEQFQQNTQALLRYDPPTGAVDADVWIADDQEIDGFPHLQPFAQCCEVMRAHHVRADHYSIMEGDGLRRISAFLRKRIEMPAEKVV